MIEPNSTRILRRLGFALSLAFCLGNVAWAAPKDPTLTVTMTNLTCSSPAGAGAFRVLSWSWGASSSLSLGSGGSGSGAGKPIIEALLLNKALDSCSPALFGAVTTGRIFSTVTMVQADSNGAPVLTLTMTNAIVTSYKVGGTPGQTPGESVAVDFEKVCVKEHASGAEFCYDRSPQV